MSFFPESPTETITDSYESNITWIITKFSERYVKLQSEKIKLPQGQNHIQWNLKLNPSNKKGTHVSIFIEVSSTNQIRVDYTLIVQDDRKKNLSPLQTNYFLVTNGDWGYNYFIKRQDILPLKNDTLIVKCWIKIDLYANNTCVQDNYKNDNKYLLDNFNNLLSNGNFSNVVLETIDGTKIPAHKCILGAQSAIFATIFKSNMKENQSNIVRILDVHKDILKAMLDFIYSNKFNRNQLKMDQLFTAASKYQIDHLKTLCEVELCPQLTVENVAEYLLLADSHNGELLKTKALYFIKINMKKIGKKNALKILETKNPGLYSDIFKYLAESISDRFS